MDSDEHARPRHVPRCGKPQYAEPSSESDGTPRDDLGFEDEIEEGDDDYVADPQRLWFDVLPPLPELSSIFVERLGAPLRRSGLTMKMKLPKMMHLLSLGFTSHVNLSLPMGARL